VARPVIVPFLSSCWRRSTSTSCDSFYLSANSLFRLLFSFGRSPQQSFSPTDFRLCSFRHFDSTSFNFFFAPASICFSFFHPILLRSIRALPISPPARAPSELRFAINRRGGDPLQPSPIVDFSSVLQLPVTLLADRQHRAHERGKIVVQESACVSNEPV